MQTVKSTGLVIPKICAKRTPEWVANYPLFVRCACLGLVAIKGPLRERTARASAQRVISAFAQTYNQADSIAEDGSDIQQAVIHAQRIDGHLNTVWRLLRSLDEALAGISPNSTGAQLTELLHSQETVFRELGACQTEGERLRRVLGKSVSSYTDALTEASDGLFPQLPFGHKIPISPSAPLGKLLDSHPAGKNAVFTSKLVSPGGMICILCTLGPKFQKLLQDKNIHDLRAATSELRDLIEQLDPVMKNARLVEQLAWRFCDVRDGNALGYIIEIFFMQIANLSNHVNRTLMSAELHRQIYINTFRAITLDWRHHDKRLETQHLILNVLWLCPEYLIGEFIAFTGEYFAGESGPHIDAIVDELGRARRFNVSRHAAEVLEAIAQQVKCKLG
ncbi:hypothetical protein BC834DRAFT_847022 [Gloeopeniophorella convolvens]|nr:hypothetical protein BC834DRAFT_847022 [Gloeopeniophorella convolvens]